MTRNPDRVRVVEAEPHESNWLTISNDDILVLISIEEIGQVLIRFTREQVAANRRLSKLLEQGRVMRLPHVHELEGPVPVEPYS